MHTCHDWLWRTPISQCIPKAVKPQVQPKIPLSKLSSQKLTDTPLRSQTGMVAWPQSLNLKLHFSDFLPTNTLRCKDIKKINRLLVQLLYYLGKCSHLIPFFPPCKGRINVTLFECQILPFIKLYIFNCFSQGSTFILEQGTSEW